MSQLVLLASTPLAEVHQDYLLQARQMQALSFVVHIPLVCFGIAFPALVLFVEWLFLRTGDELYRTLARRWTKVMAALFAAFTGSLTVISVNGWMNHPTGFHLREGKAVDVHPVQALFGNSYFWHELVHMYLAGYMVTGFLVAAAYAAARLRGRWGRYERTALAIPLAVAALCAPVQVLVGDWNGREVARAQPTKLAAFEGLGETRRGAPVHLLGWYSDGRVEYGIPIPRLLSLLAYHDPNARVAGLDAVRADERPPVNVVRIAFQTMVGIGTLLALLGLAFLAVRWRRKRLPESQWFYRALVLAGPLFGVGLIFGRGEAEGGGPPPGVFP